MLREETIRFASVSPEHRDDVHDALELLHQDLGGVVASQRLNSAEREADIARLGT